MSKEREHRWPGTGLCLIAVIVSFALAGCSLPVSYAASGAGKDAASEDTQSTPNAAQDTAPEPDWDYALDDELAESFADALATGEIEIWYQPIIAAGTGEICGAEALSRWTRDGEFISPSVFIPVLEETGQVRELDRFVFGEACRLQQELGLFPISVNLSGVSAAAEDTGEIYEEIYREAGLPDGLINIEITESVDLDAEDLLAAAADLQQRGFTLEIDDFGAGYASFAVLAAIPYDIMKLDKSLTDGIGTERGEIILEEILHLAKRLDTPVIAEGVETEEQADFLRQAGCYGLQGYYFSKALPEEEFVRFVED